MISKYNSLIPIIAGCVAVLVSCDKGRCVRNSDCDHLMTCSAGYCVVKSLDDSGVSSVKDATVSKAKDAQARTKDVEVEAEPETPTSSSGGEQGFFDMDAAK